MSALVQDAAFLLTVTLLVKPVGRYMAHVFNGEGTLLDPLLCPVERFLYRMTGVKPKVVSAALVSTTTVPLVVWFAATLYSAPTVKS